MKKISLWFRIIRPRTLLASICPVLMGLLAVGSLPNCAVAVVTLLCAISLQIFANLVNDYYDFRHGADKAGRVGPARALAEGLVSERQMLIACRITLAIALALGLFLVWSGGWVILAIGVFSVLFAWLYTATRHSLSYLGLADIVCFLFYGPVAALGAAYLQVPEFSLPALWLGVTSGCLSVCVLATNNIRDVEDDRHVGKRTFPVRFGVNAALVGVAALMIMAEVSCQLAFVSFDILGGIPFILSIDLYFRLLQAEGPRYNKCLFYFNLLNLLYVMAVAIALR